jgi:hypothetical protein
MFPPILLDGGRMRTLRFLSLTALLLAPLTLAGAQPADWRFADPGAQLIGGLEVHALLNSPLVKGALDQAAAKMGNAAPMMQMTLGTLGGVSQVFFSITGRQEDAEGLMMVKGTLDDAVARAFLQGAVAGSNGTQPKPQQPKMDMARVDASTILIGSPALLSAAVRRMQLPASAVPNQLLARAKTLAEGNDFWFGGTLPDVPAVALIGGGIKGLALGLSMQNDFRLQISLDMPTAELAQQMAAQVRKSMDETRQSKTGPDMKVETKVEGTTLRIMASMDGAQVLQVLTERLKDGVPAPGALFGGGPTKPVTTRAQPAAPQGPRSVKIYGLDDGPKEIPFPSNQH